MFESADDPPGRWSITKQKFLRRCFSVDKGLKEQVESLERELILAALRTTDGNQARAARELKISERVLRYKIRKYGLKDATSLSSPYRIVAG
jgi:DNA-binding NtrC family response regulator